MGISISSSTFKGSPTISHLQPEGSNWEALGYNTDYTDLSKLSGRPDNSYAEYERLTGRTPFWPWQVAEFNAWRSNRDAQYDAYSNWFYNMNNQWYNSEAQKLDRARSIGQNPFYEGSLIGESNSSGGPSASHSPASSPADEITGFVHNLLGNVLNVANLVNTFQNDAVQRQENETQSELLEQKAIGQAIENRKNYHLLGGDSDGLGFNSDYFGLRGRSATSFNSIRPDGAILGEEKGRFFDKSLFHQNLEANIANVRNSAAYRKFSLDNILPLQQNIMAMEAAVNGMSPAEAKEFHSVIMPYIRQSMQGQYEFNPKSVMTDVENKLKGKKLFGQDADTLAHGVMSVLVMLENMRLPKMDFSKRSYNTFNNVR